MTHEVSSSSSFSPRRKYDVFLNYYGKDTRNNIIAHLFEALQRIGIHTFRDHEELVDISSELMDAIESSKIAVVVLSENYASSTCCLKELVKILQCKNRYRQTVLPVFYGVDPSDVTHQQRKSTFEKAFVRHEERFKTEMEKVKSWKDALTEVAKLRGFKIENEAKLIKKIVGEVSKIVNQTDLYVKNSFGLDSHIEGILRLLNDGFENVHFLGIYGPAGIGKTTIAKALYNKMLQSFEGSCSFLDMVEGVSRKQKSLVTLQEQLLFDVFKKKCDIDSEDRGVNIIQRRLRSKKVLIVLDDVDDIEQLEKLVGAHDWFGKGSRIIITTRDEDVLIWENVDTKYKVDTMSETDSLLLFSRHASGQNHPPEGYEFLAKKVVKYTGGLPSALVELGTLLSDKKSQVEWETELKKLEKIPNKHILEILETRFEALDNYNRIIFLDISCFFIGFDKDEVITILDACNLYAEAGIKHLMKMSLLTINEHNKICMDDMIRDMGREIVRRESPREPGGRSRVWDNEDVFYVLRNLTGTDAVEGFEAHMSMLDCKAEKLQLTTKAFFKMKNLRLF